MKTKKRILQLIKYIYHDDLSFLPWKWDSPLWPSDFKDTYHKIRPTLFLWQEKGYITLIEDDETIFVVHPEKLPPKEKLIEESNLMTQNIWK